MPREGDDDVVPMSALRRRDRGRLRVARGAPVHGGAAMKRESRALRRSYIEALEDVHEAALRFLHCEPWQLPALKKPKPVVETAGRPR